MRMNNKELIYTLEDKIDEKEEKLILAFHISTFVLYILSVPLVVIAIIEWFNVLF